ncbi:MAG TPA: hypothetical protein VGM02_03785 [Acidobacteriaceae bacterium]
MAAARFKACVVQAPGADNNPYRAFFLTLWSGKWSSAWLFFHPSDEDLSPGTRFNGKATRTLASSYTPAGKMLIFLLTDSGWKGSDAWERRLDQDGITETGS